MPKCSRWQSVDNTHLSDSSFGDIFTHPNYSIFCKISALMSDSVNLVKKRLNSCHCGCDSMITECEPIQRKFQITGKI